MTDDQPEDPHVKAVVDALLRPRTKATIEGRWWIDNRHRRPLAHFARVVFASTVMTACARRNADMLISKIRPALPSDPLCRLCQNRLTH